ncbi:MAG: pyruvate ferredoxin oxidoreductase [Candidatus Bathyarchaeota archaeon]|nr:pyruvate ferredoxin oxidoreductase [Candidatus Bathyarchaeota archaeon]
MAKVEQKTVPLNGDNAVALAVKQCDVDVVAAYPITPQTIIVEKFSEYVADGEVDTAFVCVESEHTAMACSITASATGARVFTATASAGLALMHEMLGVASGCRAPIVMSVVNRALSAPINIHCDHSDAMSERDIGWLQIYAENSQEAYDSIIQAFKIAENLDVILPTMVGLDGFVLSHTLENVEVLPDQAVKNFVGTRQVPQVMNHKGDIVPFKLDPANPLTIGPLDLHDYYFEHKRQQEESMRKALEVIKKVHADYAKLSGRSYGNGLVEAYKLDDAEIAVVCIGSTAGTVKTVVDELREKGIKAGLLRLRTFRPLPVEDIVSNLAGKKAVAVMDRACSFGGNGGPLFHEIRHSVYDLADRPQLVNYIYGLGGRDIPPKLINRIYSTLQKIAQTGQVDKPIQFLGLRE